MFIDDEILAARQRRSDPLPALMIVVTTLVASILTAASALSSIA
jgi:hypothetical protein